MFPFAPDGMADLRRTPATSFVNATSRRREIICPRRRGCSTADLTAHPRRGHPRFPVNVPMNGEWGRAVRHPRGTSRPRQVTAPM